MRDTGKHIDMSVPIWCKQEEKLRRIISLPIWLGREDYRHIGNWEVLSAIINAIRIQLGMEEHERIR